MGAQFTHRELGGGHSGASNMTKTTKSVLWPGAFPAMARSASMQARGYTRQYATNPLPRAGSEALVHSLNHRCGRPPTLAGPGCSHRNGRHRVRVPSTGVDIWLPHRHIPVQHSRHKGRHECPMSATVQPWQGRSNRHLECVHRIASVWRAAAASPQLLRRSRAASHSHSRRPGDSHGRAQKVG